MTSLTSRGSALSEPGNVLPPAAEAPLLEVRDLRVEFQGQRVVRAVRGLTYDIAPGESLGLAGESGSGKSVSALALLGLLPKKVSRIVGGHGYL